MASFASSSATTGGARKHAWTKSRFSRVFLLFMASVRSRSLDQPLVPGVLYFGLGVCTDHFYHWLRSLPLFFLFSFFYTFCFSPTSGNLPCVKICFPQYFGITRRFFGRFSAFYGQRSVTAAWATRSPWSIFSSYQSITLYHPWNMVLVTWSVYYVQHLKRAVPYPIGRKESWS